VTPAAYPRVQTSRASSPLLFGLAPRGVFRASGVAIGAVGSYPTFSPLPERARQSKTSRRFTCKLPPCGPSGGLSFCGTIRELSSTDFSLRAFSRQVGRRSKSLLWNVLHATAHKLKSALPLPWRYQARCPFTPKSAKRTEGFFFLTTRIFRSALLRWCPDFPPAHVGAGL
jgi:hypothetical protein